MLEARSSYAPLYSPRFQIETEPGGGRRIVVPAPRSLFPMLFLPVWLCGWTVGGIAAMGQLLTHFQPFVAFWLCGWVLGEAFALTTLLWMFAGREILRVVNGDLEVSVSALGLARRRLYRGSDIRGLSASSYVGYANSRMVMEVPWVRAPRSGGIKFSYGARTVYAGVGLDETEGEMIVDALKKQLPKTAG